MAGHSKWKNIQHRKGAQDARRGKVFTKLAKEITVTARISGSDPETNARLRLVLNKARVANMPKDNIDRAIKKGTGELASDELFEKTYEGYGPGGVAVLVECLTDNVNRTVGDIRHAFTKCGGNLGMDGSVGYLFHKRGSLIYERSSIKDPNALLECALENGADDLIEDDPEAIEIVCAPAAFPALKQALDQKLGVDPVDASVGLVPDTYIELDGEKSQSLQKLLDLIEDHDDVQNVYHNASNKD